MQEMHFSYFLIETGWNFGIGHYWLIEKYFQSIQYFLIFRPLNRFLPILTSFSFHNQMQTQIRRNVNPN